MKETLDFSLLNMVMGGNIPPRVVEYEAPIVVGRFISDSNEEWDAAWEGEWPSACQEEFVNKDEVVG